MSLIVRRNRNVWDPFGGLWDAEREMSRLFSGFGGLVPRVGDGAGWGVPLDVYETKDHLVVEAEMPGLTPEDIDVSVLGTTLTIKAERKQEAEVHEDNVYRRELSYGTLQRQIELPQGADVSGLEAVYRNGVLKLTFPKREEAKPKRIKVQAK